MADDKERGDSSSEFDDLFDERKGPKEDEVHNKGKPKPDSGDGAKKPEEPSKEDASWHDNDDIEKIEKLCDEINAANKKLAERDEELRRIKVDGANISAINRLLSEAKGRQDELISKLISENLALVRIIESAQKDVPDFEKRNLRLQSENEELAKDRQDALAIANYERGKRINAHASQGLVYLFIGAAFTSLFFWFFVFRA